MNNSELMESDFSKLRVAIVHYWFVGAEWVGYKIDIKFLRQDIQHIPCRNWRTSNLEKWLRRNKKNPFP